MTGQTNGTVQLHWDRIERFLGFGRSEAHVVFIGMEERLDENDLSAELARRSTYESETVDRQLPHLASGDGLDDDEHLSTAMSLMVDLMLRRDWYDPTTRAQRIRHAKLMLGDSFGESLIVNVLPYPRAPGPWRYPERYPTRRAYMDALLPARREVLWRLLNVLAAVNHMLRPAPLAGIPKNISRHDVLGRGWLPRWILGHVQRVLNREFHVTPLSSRSRRGAPRTRRVPAPGATLVPYAAFQ